MREQGSERWERHEALLSIALLLVASAAVCWPILQSGSGWALYDWDQHFFYYAAPRRTLLEFGQFPFWNPWYCGGIPAFANPQFPALTLSFLLTLVLGVPFGLKVSAFAHAFIGMAGGWFLARAHGIDRLSAMLAGLLFTGSTVYTLHVAVGHTIWFPIAYLPWALWAYVRSRTDLRWALVIGIVMLAVALHGGLYFLVYAAILLAVWAAIDVVRLRDGRPIVALLVAGLVCALLGAIKWLPLAALLGGSGYPLEDRGSVGLHVLVTALLSRSQTLDPPLVMGLTWGWWEYGAYVGVLPLMLALLGLTTGRAGMWTAAVLAGLMLWIAAGWDAGLWPIVQRLPLGAGLRVPSRTILLTVALLGLLASAGLAAIRAALDLGDRRVLGGLVTIAVVVAIAADLAIVSHAPLSEAFAVPEMSVGSPAPFEQVLGAQRFVNRTPYPTMFPYLLENRGVVNCYERFASPSRVTPKSFPNGVAIGEYRGEAYVAGPGEARIVDFTPNRIAVEYDAPGGGLLVLNQNFDGGWHADRSPAIEHAGLIAASVPAGKGRLTFWYRPRGFRLGAAISAVGVVTLGGAALVCGARARPRARRPARPGYTPRT